MFAPPVAKPKARTASNDTWALHREPAPMFGPLPQVGASLNAPGSPEQDARTASTSAKGGPPGRGWNFCSVPAYLPGREQPFDEPPGLAPRLPIQAKLKVGAVDDPLEHEADRVADQVMRMPAPDVALSSAPPQVSRKCAECEEEEKLQTKPAGPQPAARAWNFCSVPAYLPGRDKPSQEPPGLAPRLPIQAKLKVGAVDDPLEHEADRVADQVMRMPAPEAAVTSAPPQVSRKCAECEEEEEKLQKKEAGPQAAGEAPPSVHEVLRSPGQPLDAATRAYFEHHFSYDFGRVRIHTDTTASRSAEEVAAKAYTVGSDIVFRNAEYAPNAFAGRQLLAHELAHVVQQGGVEGVLSRKECAATRACSPPDRCSLPDTGEEGTTAPSTWWSLTVNIDVEASDFKSALSNGRLGHTNVRFAESNGKQYTFGFYPAGEIPNENKRGVDGCINHPDTSHDDCIDLAETYPLSLAQYTASLTYAQNFCRSHHYYGLTSANVSYTCTTFAAEVVGAAGHKLPSSASTPTTIYYQPVPAIDNPNTLKENLEARFEGISSKESDVLSFVNLAGPNLLKRYPWQEKARWIRILLSETWITDRDVAGVERICTVGMEASDLTKVRSNVSPLVKGMNSTAQRSRVEKALKG